MQTTTQTTQITEGGKTSTEESYTTDDGIRVSISDRWGVPGEVHWSVALTTVGAWPVRPYTKIDMGGNATTWDAAREAAKDAVARARRMEQTK